MVKLMIYTFCIFLSSCYVIHNKSKLENLNNIGLNNYKLNLKGYYYREYIVDEICNYIEINKGKYIPDSNSIRQKKVIEYYIFNKEGFSLGSNQISINSFFDICKVDKIKLKNDKDNTFEYLHNKLKENLNISKKYRLPWNQGIYKIDQDSIKYQEYKNIFGDYYLVNYYGKYNQNHIIFTKFYDYRLKKAYNDTLILKFKECEVNYFENYLQQNKFKFWKNN